MVAVIILIESNGKFKIKAFIDEYSERECLCLCLWNICTLYACVCVHILNVQCLMPVSVCVSLLCAHPTGVEVSPFGLFSRHQLSFVLQEMDAADYYPRLHKFFMGNLKL